MRAHPTTRDDVAVRDPEDSGPETDRRHATTTLLAFAMAALCILSSWRYSAGYPGEDFYLIWAIAERSEVNDGRVYAVETMARIGREHAELAADPSAPDELRVLTKRYPTPMARMSPFSYALYATLFGADYRPAVHAFRILTLVATVFAILAFARTLGYSWAGSFLSIAIFTEFFEPFRSVMRTCNVSQLQLAGLASLFWLQGRRHDLARRYGAGLLLGLMLAFKPNIAGVAFLLFVLRLRRRDYRTVVGESIGLGIGIGVAALFTLWLYGGLTCWIDWFQTLFALLDTAPPTEHGNHAMSLLLDQKLGIHSSWLLLGLAALTAIYVLGRTHDGEKLERRRVDGLHAILFGSCLSLIAARLVWLHYFNLAVPLALLCLAPPYVRRIHWPALTCVILLALYPLLLVVDLSTETLVLLQNLALLSLFAIGLLRTCGKSRPVLGRDAGERGC